MNGYCDHKGCKEIAEVRPEIHIYSPVPGACPAMGMIGMELCEKHGQEMTVDDLIADDTWQKICADFVRFEKMRPDRSKTRLILRPLIHAERN